MHQPNSEQPILTRFNKCVPGGMQESCEKNQRGDEQRHESNNLFLRRDLFDAKIFPVNRDHHGAGGQHQTDLKSSINNIPFRNRGNDDD